jgi:hypothetical protein
MQKNYRSFIFSSTLVLGAIFFAPMLSAQVLQGKVSETSGEPVVFANVVLLSSTDSIPKMGVVSEENGRFVFEQVSPADYVLMVSFVGFKTFYQKISVSGDLTLNVVLETEATALEAVEVFGKKPTVQREIDRLIFNVENTALTEGSIWDILNKTPGLVVNQDQILIKNSSNVVVYINDRKVYLTASELRSLLEGSAANGVESVEVITNPPAKYDAEGGAVVNIKMKKNLATGYNGNVFANYTQGIFPKLNMGTGHFYKTDKINLYAGYSYAPKLENRFDVQGIQFIENNTNTDRWTSELDRNTKSETHTLSTNLDYFLDKKSTLSLSTTILYLPYWKRNNNSETDIFNSNNVLDSSFVTQNVMRDENTNAAFQLDYQRNLGEKGGKISSSVFYSNYYYNRTQDVSTDYFFANGDFIRNNSFTSDASQSINIFTAGIDYSGTLPNSVNIEAGTKVSTIDSNNELLQFNIVNGNLVFDPNISNTFFYDETVWAGYLSLDKSWEKWSVKTGLRSEYADITGDSPTLNLVNNRFNLKWFPSVYVSYAPSDKLSFNVSYSKRIERPRYEMLNPFQNFLTDNSFSGGNPNLDPAISHKLNLDITIAGRHTFSPYFTYTKDAIYELNFQDNTNRLTKFVSTNLERSRSVGIDYSTYFDFAKFWSFYGITSVFFDEDQFKTPETNNQLVTNDRLSNYTYLANTFTLLKDQSLTADLSWQYISPIIQGSLDAGSRQILSLSLVKSFLDGKLVASMQFNDIYNEGNFLTRTKFRDQDSFIDVRTEVRTVRFGLRYNFGNTNLKTNKKDIEAEEKNRLGT